MSYLLSYLQTTVHIYSVPLIWKTVPTSYDQKRPIFYLPKNQSSESTTKLIVIALSGQFKEVFPRYQTEGVLQQSHLQLDVYLGAHICLQELSISTEVRSEDPKFDPHMFLLQTNWEINSTELDSDSTDSWFPSIQLFCPSLLYICLTNQYFELDEIFVIVSFIIQLELFWALLLEEVI